MNEAISVLTARDDAESLHLLSRAYFATERWDDAVRSGEKAVALRPDDASYHLWLAREYGEKAAAANPMMAANLARKAKNEFERAVQLDPTNIQAHVDLAQYYTEAPAIMGGGLDKAREQAARVAQYNPAESHLVLARVAEKDKQYAEAESQLKQAIQRLRVLQTTGWSWLISIETVGVSTTCKAQCSPLWHSLMHQPKPISMLPVHCIWAAVTFPARCSTCRNIWRPAVWWKMRPPFALITCSARSTRRWAATRLP